MDDLSKKISELESLPGNDMDGYYTIGSKDDSGGNPVSYKLDLGIVKTAVANATAIAQSAVAQALYSFQSLIVQTSGQNIDRVMSQKAVTDLCDYINANLTNLTGIVGNIMDKIPTAASPFNQLADKDFVNSSIASATATFVGTYSSLAQLQAVTGAKKNDYGYVTSTSGGVTTYSRYKYNGSAWEFEYTLNNSSFTAAEIAAIDSGITAEKVSKLDALPTNAALRTALDGKQATISDIGTIRNGAALGATALQSYTETDPTVPAWAKTPSKPTYTATEVGALPANTAIPSALADLSDDSTHRTVTDAEKTAWNNKTGFSGNYNDLTNKPTIPDELADLADDATHRTVTDTEKAAWNAKSTFSGNYNDLTNKPTVPTALSDLSDDTTHRVVTDAEKAAWNAKYTKPSGGIPATDLTSAAQASIALANSAVQTETDPTVPSWAKAQTKPTYTAVEVGALPSTTALADLADDSTHRTVTDAQKTAWSAKYDKPSGGIPATDLASGIQTALGKAENAYQKPSGGIPSSDMTSAVQASLAKADTAIQSHQDISGKEDVSNKVTALSSGSTDAQYPSAKSVFDKFTDPAIIEKTYDAFRTTSSNWVHCFLKFSPTAWDKVCTIRYRITAWVPNVDDTQGTSEVMLQVYRGVVKAYYFYNAFADTSKRPYYTTYFYGQTAAGFTNGADNFVGVNMYNNNYVYTYTVDRQYKVQVISATDCTYSLFDSDTNVTTAKGENAASYYQDYVTFNSYTNGLQETGDENTGYSIISDAELQAGTETTGRVISAARLKANYYISGQTVNIAGDTLTVPVADTATPAMDGTAAVGTSSAFAHGDHVHPTDTSRAPLASPAFTGTPTAPTADDGTETTQVATTAFVASAVGQSVPQKDETPLPKIENEVEPIGSISQKRLLTAGGTEDAATLSSKVNIYNAESNTTYYIDTYSPSLNTICGAQHTRSTGELIQAYPLGNTGTYKLRQAITSATTNYTQTKLLVYGSTTPPAVHRVLRVLFVGSSWHMSTWWYLNKMFADANVVADLHAYYMGHSQFYEWSQLYNNDLSPLSGDEEDRDARYCLSFNGADWSAEIYNDNFGGAQSTVTAQEFRDAFYADITAGNWDIIAYQQGAKETITWDAWSYYPDLVSILRRNLAPGGFLAFNGTWTPGVNWSGMSTYGYENTVEGQREWQDDSNHWTKQFMVRSGQNKVAPNGAMVWAMRRDNTLNLSGDMTSDNLHLQNGLPMYAVTGCWWETFIQPSMGISFDSVSWMPTTSTQKIHFNGSGFQNISAAQQTLIRKYVKLSLSDRFGFRTL